MKLENQRLMCNNMNVADGVETMDVTPSWRTAIKMWFTGIRNTTNLMQTADDCEKEMIRLATAYEGAVERIQADAERIDQLESDLEDARTAYDCAADTLHNMSGFELASGNEVIYQSDIVDHANFMDKQTITWRQRTLQLEVEDKPLKTALQSDF
jgi:hypothetical protein